MEGEGYRRQTEIEFRPSVTKAAPIVYVPPYAKARVKSANGPAKVMIAMPGASDNRRLVDRPPECGDGQLGEHSVYAYFRQRVGPPFCLRGGAEPARRVVKLSAHKDDGFIATSRQGFGFTRVYTDSGMRMGCRLLYLRARRDRLDSTRVSPRGGVR